MSRESFFWRVFCLLAAVMLWAGSGLAEAESNIAGAIRELPVVRVSGTLTRDIEWSPDMGTMLITSSLTVPANRTLTLLAGSQVRMETGATILALDGGTIDIAGSADQPVVIAPFLAGSLWREIVSSNENSSIIVRHAEISGGRTAVRDGASGLFEDSYFHDFRPTSCGGLDCPILLSSFASSLVVRRCHFREYYETLFRDGVIVVEDSLFEYASGDALDFDGAQPGSVVRRCTFRHGTLAPYNIDAIDIGPGQLGGSRGVLVEDCLIYDFPTDKGVSIGDAPNPAKEIVIRNSLVYACKVGLQVKDNSVAQVYGCTIVDTVRGFSSYNKANPAAATGGGHATNVHNNIVWSTELAVSLLNAGTLSADHCNFEMPWPGAGNMAADPMFVDAAVRDYRLAADSPCRSAGRDGQDMGARFPVGAPMAPSHPEFESVRVADGQLILRFWADSELTYTIQSSTAASGSAWEPTELPAYPRPHLAEIRRPIASDGNRFYRIKAGRK